MYSFALRPKWILIHLLIGALVFAMVGLGFWQLNRLDERKDRNALVEARNDEVAVSLDEALADGTGEQIRYVKVEMDGEYVGPSIFVDNRSINGSPGSWLATPFTSGQTTVLVVRGFMGRSAVLDSSPDSVTPPSGTVTIAGSLQPGDRSGAFAQRSEGVPGISHPNVEAIAERFDVPMSNAFVLLEQPAEASTTPVPLPALDEGSHFSYAVQWFLFASIAAIGYALILRRTAGSPGDVRSEMADEQTADRGGIAAQSS